MDVKAMTYHEVPDASLELYLRSPVWVGEVKLDGVRTLATVSNGNAQLLNRNGKPLAGGPSAGVRATVECELGKALTEGEWVLDGELMDDGRLWLFDLLKADELVNPTMPLETRRKALVTVAGMLGWTEEGSRIRLVGQAKTEAEKRELLETIKEAGGEGIMLKREGSPYVMGKRTEYGLKVKLTKTVDVFVISRNTDGKENATLGVRDGVDGPPVVVGKCSMIGKPNAQPGDVIEVKYLYVGANGRLYQPRMMRIRKDKAADECLISQLDGMGVNKAVAA